MYQFCLHTLAFTKTSHSFSIQKKPFSQRNKVLLLFSIAFLLCLPLSTCQAANFNSVQGGSWEDGATWGNTSPGVAGVDFPSSVDTAMVFGTHTVILVSNTSLVRLLLRPGSQLEMGSNDITVTSSLVNHGSSSGAGRLILNGTVQVGGHGNWGAGDVLVDGTTTFVTNSIFRVNASNMVIESGGTVSGNGRVYITGSLIGHVDGTSTFINGSNAFLSVSGSLLSDGILVATASGNRVLYESGSNTIKTPTPPSYEKLSLYGSATKTISTDLTVADDIILSGTTNIDIGSNALTLGGRIFLYTTATSPITFGDGTLNLTASTLQSLSGTYELNGLIVNNAAGVNYTGASMLIKDSLCVVNGNFSTNNNVTLVSDASGTARVGELTGTITGNVTVQRHVDAANNWHLVAMPITNGTLEDWSDDTPMTGFPGSHYPNFGWVSVSFYDELLPGPMNDGFVDPTGFQDAVTNGTGIWLYMSPGLLDVTGPLPAGDVNIPMTYTPDSGFDEDGWNLAGNPFASPIRWADFSTSSLEDQYWIYDPATGNFANWNETTQTGTLGANGIIPSGQAFNVHSIAAGPTLDIPQSSKTSTAPAFKNNLVNTLSIRLYAKGAKLCDELVVQDMPITYSTFEHGLDQLKLFPPVHQRPAISSVSSEGYPLAINTIDFTDPASEALIMFHHMEEGNYMIGGWEGYEGCENLWLEDLITGKLFRLSEIKELSFEAIPDRDEPRFKLHFSQDPQLANNQVEVDPSWIVHTDQGTVFMNITNGVDEPSLIQVFTLDGKMVETTQLSEGTQTLNMPLPEELAQGGILLRWMSGSGETLNSEILLNR